MQRRQSLQIMGMNKELEANNDFLATLSMKILALYFAADLQEHFQRAEGRHDPDRAQEAHDLLLGHPELHRHHRAASARADYAVAQ
jgi:hypothetical protein